MIAYNARMHTQGDSMGRLVRRDVNLAPNSLLALSSTAVRTPVAAVVTETAAAALPGAAAAQTDTDDYPTRMAKYVPAEVVAFYLAADKLFTKGAGAAATGLNLAEAFVQKNLYYFSVAVFVIALIGTPFYYRQLATNNEPWKVQAAIATVAFVIWAYAVQGGIYSEAELYSAAIASFLVLVWTFAAGFVKPGK